MNKIMMKQSDGSYIPLDEHRAVLKQRIVETVGTILLVAVVMTCSGLVVFGFRYLDKVLFAAC